VVLRVLRRVRKKLIFLLDFNIPIHTLPFSVTFLYFGRKFNQSVTNLPSSITTITFGKKFNSLVTFLPFLTHLTFGEDFVQPISALPSTLSYFAFLDYFLFSLIPILSPNLKRLIITFELTKPLKDLPISLEMLEFEYGNLPLNDLPPSLVHLKFQHNSTFNQPVRLTNNKK
jgi:hypothetical protein